MPEASVTRRDISQCCFTERLRFRDFLEIFSGRYKTNSPISLLAKLILSAEIHTRYEPWYSFPAILELPIIAHASLWDLRSSNSVPTRSFWRAKNDFRFDFGTRAANRFIKSVSGLPFNEPWDESSSCSR